MVVFVDLEEDDSESHHHHHHPGSRTYDDGGGFSLPRRPAWSSQSEIDWHKATVIGATQAGDDDHTAITTIITSAGLTAALACYPYAYMPASVGRRTRLG